MGYHLRARASYTDGHGPGKTAQAASTQPVQAGANRPPKFDSATATREVPENTEAGENIGAPVTANDPDTGDTLTYTLEGADLDSFDIDSASGQIQTKPGVTYDHEIKSSYSVTVKADDNNGGTATIDVTITVADVNEPPKFSVETASRTIAENTTTGVAIGDPVTANDPDNDTLTYTLGGTDANFFDIDTSTGQLRTQAALDYETRNSYTVTVTATDPSNATGEVTVTITVTDEDEGGSVTLSSPPAAGQFRAVRHPERPRRRVRLAMLPNSGGISPLRRLKERDNCVSVASSPNSGGVFPLSWFPTSLRYSRLASLPSSGGIAPLNMLPPAYSRLSLTRFPNSGGISPVNRLPESSWLPERFNSVRLAMLPNSGGISPVNRLSETSISVSSAVSISRPCPSQ